MEIELSAKTTKAAKAAKLKPEEMAFADLVATRWEPNDAFILAFRKGSTWNKAALRDEVNNLLDKEAVKNRISEVQKVLTDKQIEAAKATPKKQINDVVKAAMSKEQMLYDLQTALTDMTKGSKEWLDTKKLIVEVTRMKQDEVKDDNNTIHHFLPVLYPTGCEDCLYSRCDTCKYKSANVVK